MTQNSRVIERGKLRMDLGRHTCTWNANPITLTVTEYLILQALAQRPRIVKSRDRANGRGHMKIKSMLTTAVSTVTSNVSGENSKQLMTLLMQSKQSTAWDTASTRPEVRNRS